MWFLLMCLQVPALEAQERIALKGSDRPCRGRVEVYHKNQWGLVCSHGWLNTNDEVVCRSLGCGSPQSSNINKYPPKYTPSTDMVYWMDEVMCSGQEESLLKCKFSGWNVTQCNLHNYITVECSGNINLTLNHNRKNNKKMCAGVVQFKATTFNTTVCNKDWDASKADMVCRELNCGSHHKIPKSGTFQGDPATHYVPLSCVGGETLSWQCVDWPPPNPITCHEEANVICSNYFSVRLHGGTDVCNGTLQKYGSAEKNSWAPVSCTEDTYKMIEDMCSELKCGKPVSVKPCNESKNVWLTCSDRIKVELVSPQRSSQCHGEVYVSVNGSRSAVCSDGMDEEEYRRMGKVVCRELKCGNLIVASQGKQELAHVLSHVNCHGDEDSLWECLSKYSPGPPCKTVNVICADSVDVRLRDGLDRCSGRLEVQFDGSWWSALEVAHWRSNADVVCGHLKCGKSSITGVDLFVKGMHSALKWKPHCENSSTSISQCFWNKAESQISLKNTVNIICTSEEIWYLEGNSSCEGIVKVEAAGKTRLITLEEDTWTNETAAKVCKRLLCGDVRSFTPKNNTRKSCYANSTSPSECSNETVTLAHVSCSGSVEVRLENCSGKVLVCPDGKCKGVCWDTWKRNHSQALCQKMNCSDVIGEYEGPVEPGVTVGSVYCPDGVSDLSQCNFMLMSNDSNCQKSAYISCEGSVKPRLSDHRDRCAGPLELFYLGQWRPVCHNGTSKEAVNAMCIEMGCGDVDRFKPDDSKASGLQVTCRDSAGSRCHKDYVEVPMCHLGHLTCTNWSRFLLINPTSACAGTVFEMRGSVLHVLSNQSWTKEEHPWLCEKLQCGHGSPVTARHELGFWTSDPCVKNNGSMWDCEVKQHQSSTDVQRLHIKCNDEPVVNLEGNCTGEVRIKQNEGVCDDSQNTTSVLNELCYQLKCGAFIHNWSTPRQGRAQRFSCTGLENRLWQCSSKEAQCSQVMSMSCSNSVEFRFLGKCGGELQVRYRGHWEPVCPIHLKDANEICQKLQCGNATSNTTIERNVQVNTSFSCEGKLFTEQCIRTKSCHKGHASIICEKFEVANTAQKLGLTVVLPVGLVVMLVLTAVVLWQRKLFRYILRFRSSDRDVEVSSDEVSRDLPGSKPSMYEMDNYKESPRSSEESTSHGEDENNSSSGDSSGTDYDDVDEANVNVKPLLPPRDGLPEPVLPPRPASSLNDVVCVEELDMKDDYDDVMSVHNKVSNGEQTEQEGDK